MEDILKKKKKAEMTPVFQHESHDIQKAIGVPGLIESISDKMLDMHATKEIISPSRAVEYFYENFTNIELAFMAMHHLGRSKDTEDELDENIYSNSIALGDTIAALILKRAAADNYKKTRGMPKYSVFKETGKWQQTPPDYADAIEPNWKLIQPLLLD